MLKLPLEKLYDLLLNQINMTEWISLDFKSDSLFGVISNSCTYVGTLIYLVDLISIKVVGIYYTNQLGFSSVSFFSHYIKVDFYNDTNRFDIISFQSYDLLNGKSLYKTEESDYKDYITSLIFMLYNLSKLKSMLKTCCNTVVTKNLELRVSEVTNNLEELLSNYKGV